MGRLVDGVWSTDWYQPDTKGRFVRPETSFRDQVVVRPSAGGGVEGAELRIAEAGRYHLYVAMACPWAHRTLIARRLLGLESVIGLSVVHPEMLEQGWELRDTEGNNSDPLLHKSLLYEVYLEADPNYSGRVTVPILWDSQRNTIVNNESREILRMFSTAFAELGAPSSPVALAPSARRAEIDAMIEANYEPINNGVYRAGFASTQAAYEEAVQALFGRLDALEAVLAEQEFLVGDAVSEADICLYTTLVRFDLVYHGHFKCNLRRIQEYPGLWRYLRSLYALPGFGDTTDLEAIKRHYYYSHETLNPKRIVPLGPKLDFSI